eukprot:gene11329-12515_t
MSFTISRLLRSKNSILLSISINVILLLLLIKSYTNIRNNDVVLSRREIQKNHAPTSKQDFFLLIIILASPNGYERRKAIRQTWLSFPIKEQLKIGHRFIIGTAGLKKDVKEDLIEEERHHKDVLLLDNHKESYYSLTSKLLKTFIWIKDNIDSKFVLKVDDDTFVRTNVLMKDLKAKQKFQRIYWGFFRGDANVKKAGKWAEKDWVLCDKYLPYANGGGYILTQDLVNHIAQASDMLQIYNNEDVAVGTWLAPVLLNRIHDVRFDTEYKSRGCSNKHIVSHKQSIDDLYTKYHELLVNNRLCQMEVSVRKSFDYDWKAKPSMCCRRTKNLP